MINSISPSYDGKQIFDSIDAQNNKGSEGVLFATEYHKVIQKLHFNGEDGDRYLTHGYPDRPWTFNGIISAASTSSLWTILSTIQGYIDAADADPSTYHQLVDSFGNTYEKAQIHSMTIQNIHVADNGYVAWISVQGIISGMVSEGGTASQTSSSSSG